MSAILNIDTAIDTASISIAREGEILAKRASSHQKDHARFLHTAVVEILKSAGISLLDLDAIAVVSGPGSYTGLRVGMASAKGFCYALNIPLVAVSTFEMLTVSAISQTDGKLDFKPLFCPMIDARRMEVYAALYDGEMMPVVEPLAMVLDERSFSNLLDQKIFFFGNGAEKWKNICPNPNALFLELQDNELALSKLAYKKYQYNDFTSLAYSEPFYLKEFGAHTGQK